MHGYDYRLPSVTVLIFDTRHDCTMQQTETNIQKEFDSAGITVESRMYKTDEDSTQCNYL